MKKEIIKKEKTLKKSTSKAEKSASSPRQVRVESALDESASSLHKKGFSLVEMLVATAVFMSIMTLAITSLISIISANKKAQLIKNTIDSVNFAVENISRDMRTGTDYECMTMPPDTFSKTCLLADGSTAVKYARNPAEEVTYEFIPSTGVLTRKINLGSPIELISQDSNVNITSMKFYIIGADKEDPVATPQAERTQPRVIITASGLISVNGINDTSFNLQTNISQRARR